jgi:hypothetical protein
VVFHFPESCFLHLVSCILSFRFPASCHSDAEGGGIFDAIALDKLNYDEAAVANKIPLPHAASE